MYIQPKREEAAPQVLPEGYSGSAFLPSIASLAPTEPTARPSVEMPTETEEAQESVEAATRTAAHDEKRSKEAAPVGRFPLLSSLLPPKRGKKEGGELPEWVLIAAVFLLLFADGEKNDILPFLLLLLLWD